MPVDTLRRIRLSRFLSLCLTGSLLTACVNPLARPVATATPAALDATATPRPLVPTPTPPAPTATPTPSGPGLRAWTNAEAVEYLREAQRLYFLGAGDAGDVSAEATALLAAEVAGRYAEPGSAAQSQIAWEFLLARIVADSDGYGSSDAVRHDLGTSLDTSLNASHSTSLADALRTLSWDFALTSGETHTIWKKGGAGAWVVGVQTPSSIVAAAWLQLDPDGTWTARVLDNPMAYAVDGPTILIANVAGGPTLDVVIAETQPTYDTTTCDGPATVIVDPGDVADLSSARRVTLKSGLAAGICGSWRIGDGAGQGDPQELVYSTDVYVADECDLLTDEHAYRWSVDAFSPDAEHSGMTLPPDGSACGVLWALSQDRDDPAAFSIIQNALTEWPTQLDTLIGPAARDYLRFELALRDAARGLSTDADEQLAALIGHPSGPKAAFAVKVARAYRDAETSDGLWSPCNVAQRMLTEAMPEDLWSHGYDSAAPALRDAYGFAPPSWMTAPDLACTGSSMKDTPISASFDDEAAFSDWLTAQGVALTLTNRTDFDADGQPDWLIVNATGDAYTQEWHIFLQRDGQLTQVLGSTIQSDFVDAVDVKPINLTDKLSGWLITTAGSSSVARITPTAKLLFDCACSAGAGVAVGDLTLDTGETYRYDAAQDTYLAVPQDVAAEPSIEADLATAAAMLYFDKDVDNARRLIKSALRGIGDTPDDSYWHELRSRALYLEASSLEEADPAKAAAKYQVLVEDYSDTLVGWLATRKLTP